MMRRREGETREGAFQALAPHAPEYVNELIAEFRLEKEHGLKCWLLELIGMARSEAAFDCLVEQLEGDDESLHYWAVTGLETLGTIRPLPDLFYKRQRENRENWKELLGKVRAGDPAGAP